jgi:hypothetical protein
MRTQRRWFLAWKEGLGQDMLDYSFLLGFIGLVAIGLLDRYESQIKGFLTTLSSMLPG